jgi:3-oxoacyl-[acyl-carrier protein] reductase
MPDSPLAFITGASRGLGRATAVTFGRKGWRVVIAYHENDAAANETMALVAAAGGKASLAKFDVADADAFAAAVKDAAKDAGRLDALIMCAGCVDDKLILRTSRETWDRVMAVDLDQAYHGIKAAARAMARRKSGHIVAIGSIAGLTGRAGGAAYSAAKAGLISLVKSAARELGPSGICVNAVLPGFLDTDMGAAANPDYRAKVIAESVLQMPGDADEVAAFIAHLVTMKRVSGQVFNLDGRIVR